MNKPHQRINQGVRSNRYSGSKLTNWTDFQPWDCAIERAFRQHQPYLRKESEGPLIYFERPHQDFILPLELEDIEDTLSKIPSDFTRGLQAVFLLSGSNKLSKVVDSLYCYGTYWLSCIFLAPFPKVFEERCYPRPPRPSAVREYIRAGAEVRQTTAGLVIKFEKEAIRRFYIRDVLMHEIGHHIDRYWKKPHRKKEGFAEWFATEYGYRMRQNVGSGDPATSQGP